MKMKKRLAKRTKIISIFLSALLTIGILTTVLTTNQNWMKADAASVSTASLADMRARAEAIVNYEWIPSQNISTWNGNSYNGSTVFKKGSTVKGMPYTLFTSEIVGDSLLSLAQYKNVASSNYSASAKCKSTSNNWRTGPVYGSCCATFVSEVFGGSFMNGSNPLYDSVKAIEGSSYATHITNAKASQIQAGDALSKSGHIIWIGDVTDSCFVVYEQTPPIARKVVVKKSSSINSNGYFVYEGSVYSTISRINVTGNSAISLTAPIVTTSNKYYASNAQVTVNWNAVEGASLYWIDVYKDGYSVISKSTDLSTSCPINAGDGFYEVYVTAANGSSTARSQCYTFNIGCLDKPVITSTEKYYATGAQVTIKWSACTGATKYHVSVWRADEAGAQGVPYGDGKDVYETSYTFNPDDGYYGVFVDAINANGGYQGRASDKYNFFVGNMRAPIIDSSIQYFAENGDVTIKWNACEGATDYFIHFWKDHEDFFGELTNGATSYTLQNAANGYYGVYVSAINATGGYQWETSEKYNFTVGKLGTPVLDTSIQYYASGAPITIQWDECEGATQYHVSVWRADKAGTQGESYCNGDVEGTSYTFYPTDGYYGVFVDAMNQNGGVQITNSEKYNFHVGTLEQPVVTTAQKYYDQNAKVTVQWNPCEGATRYHVIVWIPEERIISEEVSGTSYTFDTEESKYGVFVFAVNENGGYQDIISDKLNFYSTSFTLDKSSLSLKVGDSTSIVPTVAAMDPDDTIRWTSSDTAVATVDANGKVTAVGAGQAVIQAALGNLVQTCSVSVAQVQHAEEITISKTNVTMKLGETSTLTATITPANSADTVTWQSSNTKVVTVDQNGRLNAVSVGKATITATAGSKSSSCIVNVANTIKLSQYKLALAVNDSKHKSFTLKAASKPSGVKKVTWYSSNASVVKVSASGKVTAVKKGTANIYCKSTTENYVSAPCVVTVDSFDISYTNPFYYNKALTVISNKPFQMSVKNTNHGKVTWKSSNANVARVDGTGKVTGLKKGTVTITATAADKTTTKVKLKIIAATTSITFKQNPVEVYAGKKATVKAVYSKGSNDPVTWSSSDPSVATVTNKGVVQAKKQGTAIITVKALSGKTATMKVIVHSKAQALQWVTAPPPSLKVGQTANVSMKITAPANCDDTVKWTSSNGKVLSVTPSADGKTAVIKGLKKGNATVTAKTGGGKKLSYKIKVG